MTDLSGVSTDELMQAAGLSGPATPAAPTPPPSSTPATPSAPDLSQVPTDQLLQIAGSAPSGPHVQFDPSKLGEQVGTIGGTPAYRSPNGDLYINGTDSGAFVKVPSDTRLD